MKFSDEHVSLHETFLVIAAFFILSLFIYGLSLPHSFITLNDSELVYQNPFVQHISFSTIKAAFTHFDPELYIPFTFLSYQLDWWLGGGSAFVFHLDNLLLHTIDALLVWWLMYLLSRNKWIGFICGLVFLVHPINTEAVLWVSARKDLLSSFFGRLTLLMYVYYLQRNRRGFLYGSIMLLLCALLAKVKVILLPLIMLLIDWKEGRPWSATLFYEKIPHFCLSVLFLIIAVFGKKQVLISSDLSTKIFLAVKSMVFYIQQFLIPRHFSIYYPHLSSVSLFSTDFLSHAFLLLIFCTIALLSLRWTKEILFGCALYLIGIIPSFTNLAKGDLFIGSDRYPYTALVGVTYAVAGVFLLCWQRYRQQFGRKMILVFRILAVTIIGMLSILSYRQSFVWADSIALFRQAIALNPQYYLPYYDLGVALDAQNNKNDAIAAYTQSLSLSEYPLARVNLGRDYYVLGQREQAREQFLLALKKEPHFAMASFNLGVMDGEDGKYEDARRHYQKAIADEPFFIDARLNLAAMEADHGDVSAALQGLHEALAIDPRNKRTLSLAALFIKRGILK